MTLYLLAILMTFLGALGAYFLKKGAERIGGWRSMLQCFPLYLGAVFYFAASLLNIILLRYIDYSVLYPMTAITYIWSMLLAWRLLGEHLTKRKLAGVSAILVGVCLLVF